MNGLSGWVVNGHIFSFQKKAVAWLAMNTVRRPQDTNHFLLGLCFRDLRGIFVTSTLRHRAWELLEGLGIRLQSNRRLLDSMS